MDKPQDPDSAETVQTTSVPAVDLPRLVGLLCFAGDLEVNGEEISGCAVDIDRATLIAAKSLPMYEQCVIVTAAELQKMEGVIEAARCIRHWHDREGGGMVVSAKHVHKLWDALHDLHANAGGMARELAAQDSESITDLNG